MNNVTLIGRLAREWREVDKESGFMAFNTVAINRGDRADFVPICFTDESGKNAVKYTAKGDKVGVTGSLTVYTKGEGDEKRTEFYVSGRSIDFLENKKAATGEGIPFEK